MNAKSIGAQISRLRREKGITQSQLAAMLDITNKAVSKWESGQGYPDITLLPSIASVFGVSIDYLMLGERKGITVAGNMVADVVKTIDAYPSVGMLTNIKSTSCATGGCSPNVGMNLVKIDRTLPVAVAGKLGEDEHGRFILSELQRRGINVERVKFSETKETSFSDVMSMPSGERTFFHSKGASAEFSPEDIDVDALNCDIFHIGYILLLDKFDEEDPEYGTRMARFLSSVQARGIKTSVDLISNKRDDYGGKVIPSLRFCDYVIINEIECCSIWGLSPYYPNGKMNVENIETAIRKTYAAGVREKVIVHSKKLSFMLSAGEERIVRVPSLKIPAEDIKGSVGAGDAFCAGCLYGLYHGMTDKKLLEFASAAAACNLFSANAVDGMRSKAEIYEIENKYRRLNDEEIGL